MCASSSRILSPDNAKIRLIRKLRSKKYRDAALKFTIEGMNLVSEAIRREIDIDFILCTESVCRDCDNADLIFGARCEVNIISSNLMNSISEAGHGISVLAVISKESLYEGLTYDYRTLSGNVLVLDRLQDPGNIGTMIRTAYAAGYIAVYAMIGTGDVYSPKVLRATAGTIFDIPVRYVRNVPELLRQVGMKGKKLAVSVPVDGKPYYDCDLSSNTALVIGNEGRGVSDEFISAADERITIPMRKGIESLNAAISSAILMYEAMRCGWE